MAMTLQEIKELKKQLGYTNTQLAELSGVPLSTVQKVLGNTTSAPRYNTLRKLEEALLRGKYNSEKHSPEKHDSKPLISGRYTAGMPVSDHNTCYPGFGRQNQDILLQEAPAPYYIDPESSGRHTVRDYYALPEERRAELIDGIFYDMAAPDGIHQDILLILASFFRDYIRKNNGGCRVYVAPRDVQLDQDDDKTIVQPDILIVCDRSKITAGCILGAPDLIVEILSPSTREKDLHLKVALYANAGVREYWIVDPEKRIVLVYLFSESRFPACFSFADSIPVGIWDEHPEIDFRQIAEEIDDYYN